jgi:hypothetical protein
MAAISYSGLGDKLEDRVERRALEEERRKSQLQQHFPPTAYTF